MTATDFRRKLEKVFPNLKQSKEGYDLHRFTSNCRLLEKIVPKAGKDNKVQVALDRRQGIVFRIVLTFYIPPEVLFRRKRAQLGFAKNPKKCSSNHAHRACAFDSPPCRLMDAIST